MTMASNCEDCDMAKTLCSARIAITVESAIGLLLEFIISVIVIYIKAYKTFLQRLFVWIIIVLIVMDMTRVTSFAHHLLSDKACKTLSFIQLWSVWCTYTFLMVLLVYLLVRVCIEIRNTPGFVTKLKNSKVSRLLLELGLILASLILPTVVLWVPFNNSEYKEYGFNGIMCGFRPSNHSDVDNGSFQIFFYFLTFAPPELAGLIAIFAALGMIVLYCTLSSKLQRHQQARLVIKKLTISVLVVVALVVAYNISEVLWIMRPKGYHHYMLTVCIGLLTTNLEKMILLIGYLLTFHFSNICTPLKKLIKRKRRDLRYNPSKQGYGTIGEPDRSTSPSNTYFNVSYTGQFTTVSNV